MLEIILTNKLEAFFSSEDRQKGKECQRTNCQILYINRTHTQMQLSGLASYRHAIGGFYRIIGQNDEECLYIGFYYQVRRDLQGASFQDPLMQDKGQNQKEGLQDSLSGIGQDTKDRLKGEGVRRRKGRTLNQGCPFSQFSIFLTFLKLQSIF